MAMMDGIIWYLSEITAVPLMVILLGGGAFLTTKLGFFQFRYFGYIMKNTIGSIFKKNMSGNGNISPFRATTNALASTIGTANIV